MFLSQDTHVDYEYLGVCVPVHIVHDIPVHVLPVGNRSIFNDEGRKHLKFLKPQELKFLLVSLQMLDLSALHLYIRITDRSVKPLPRPNSVVLGTGNCFTHFAQMTTEPKTILFQQLCYL